MELHAHIETHTVDCDGPLDRSYTLEMNDTERASQFIDLDFMQRIMSSIVNIYGQGTLTVTPFDDGTSRLVWSEPTDEGHRHAEATFCTDDGCDMGYSQRDHYAEAMGY